MWIPSPCLRRDKLRWDDKEPLFGGVNNPGQRPGLNIDSAVVFLC